MTSATEGSPLLGGTKTDDGDRATSFGSPITPHTVSSFSSDDELPLREEDEKLLSIDIEFQEPVKFGGEKKNKTWRQKIDENAFLFGLRMAVLLTVSALFVLIRTENYSFPDGMWVLVTVLFVGWFPNLDAASVIEKITQRLIGTFVGAFLGLACGFISLVVTQNHLAQAIFLGVCVFVVNFLIIFLAGQFKVGRVKVISKFSYATILCVLTFCICILPFSQKTDPKWNDSLYRVLNVIIGCLVGGLGSIVIAPKSTTDVLHSKAARQVVMAGEAADAVLQVSSDFFAGRIEVNGLADELLNTPLDSEMRWRLGSSSSSLRSTSSVQQGATDVALKKYEDAIADWGVSKMLFPLTKYDPFKIRLSDHTDPVSDAFHTEIARTLARCLRIQTTIVVLDGMVRSDADYSFKPEQLISFSETGQLIKQMLHLPLEKKVNDEAARKLFVKLEETREAIQNMSTKVSEAEEEEDADRLESLADFRRNLLAEEISSIRTNDDMGRGIPLNATGRNDNTLFFLQLVEHLILRSMRLYQAWTHVVSIEQSEDFKK